MSFLKNIQNLISPKPVENMPNIFGQESEVIRGFKNFSNSYRIGILCYFTDYEMQEEISNYKKRLEQLGYECDVLLFIDKKERENNIYLHYFDWNDLDKKTTMPHSPKTDRIVVKKYDMLFNLYFQDSAQLKYIAQLSMARCRVGPFVEPLKSVSDILIPCGDTPDIATLIININSILNLKPYARKQI